VDREQAFLVYFGLLLSALLFQLTFINIATLMRRTSGGKPGKPSKALLLKPRRTGEKVLLSL
jgi:hypothetical protein